MPKKQNLKTEPKNRKVKKRQERKEREERKEKEKTKRHLAGKYPGKKQSCEKDNKKT